MKRTFYFLILTAIAVSSSAQVKNDTLIPFRDKNLWGFANKQLKVVIKPAYDTVYFFDDKYAGVDFQKRVARVVKNGKMGLVNRQGKVVVPIVHTEFEAEYWGYPFVQNNKMGLYDFYGKLLIPAKYDRIGSENNNNYEVILGKKRGLIDPKGKLIIPIEYDDVYVSFEYIVATTFDNTHEYFDFKGKSIKATKEMEEANEAQIAAPMSMDEAGPPPPENPNVIKPLNYIIKENGKYGYLYQRIEQMPNSISRWWLRDSLPPVYDTIIDKLYYHNFFIVSQNGKWGAVNSAGKVIIPLVLEYLDADPNRFQVFQQVMIKKDGKWGITDRHGSIIVPVEYDAISIEPYSNYYRLIKGDKQGLAWTNDKEKTIIVPAKYTRVESPYINDDFILIPVRNKAGRLGFVDEKQKEYFKD